MPEIRALSFILYNRFTESLQGARELFASYESSK